MRESFGLKHSRTKPYHQRTNGKAERLIQTVFREWTYGPTWQSSDERDQALSAWLHFHTHHRHHPTYPFTRLKNFVVNDTCVDEEVARLSPLIYDLINLLGRYSFSVPEAVTRGELCPLRVPAEK